MKNSTLWMGGIVVIALVLGGVWYIAKDGAPNAVVQDDSLVAGESEEVGYLDGSKDSAPEQALEAPILSVTVRYTDNGFSPENVTVKKGTRVTFVDEHSEEDMWVGVDEHPTHTGYDGTTKDEHCTDGKPSTTTFDQCGKGTTYSFTFMKEGAWDYHNHVFAKDGGTVLVAE